MASVIATALLPRGFPDSVTPDYLEFQLYDSLQAITSYVRGTLSAARVLEGLGVGSAAASPIAASSMLVFRDLSGMLSKLVFAIVSNARGTFDAGTARTPTEPTKPTTTLVQTVC